jgi:hypothetical protein
LKIYLPIKFFSALGLSPELVLPISLLEVIGGIFLIVGVIGATLIVWLSQGFAGGPLLKQAAILMSSLSMAISISPLLTGLGIISIEWNVFKREVFPRGKYIIQNYKDLIM